MAAPSDPPAARPRDRTGRAPLWARVLGDLEARIASEEFATGFPTNRELGEQYAVSRHTVRRALDVLRDRGVLVSGRGLLTRAPGRAEIARYESGAHRLLEAVTATGLSQRSVVHLLRAGRHRVAAGRLGLAPGASVVRLERLCLAGDEPVALDRAYLPRDVAGPLLDADLGMTPLDVEYTELCGVRIDDTDESIRTAVATDRERGLLDIDRAVALFVVERTATSLGRLVEWRRTLVRGDLFALATGPVVHEGFRRFRVTGPLPDGWARGQQADIESAERRTGPDGALTTSATGADPREDPSRQA